MTCASELSHYAAKMPELFTHIVEEKVSVGAALEQEAQEHTAKEKLISNEDTSFAVPDATLAERERFELSVQRLTIHPLSRRTP
jgi:hypothetical protein